MNTCLALLWLATCLVPIPAPSRSVRLPEIKLVKITSTETVYIRADNVLLERMDGDRLIQDRYYIDGATGKTHRDTSARRPDEMSLKVGETCLIGGASEFHKFRLMSIRDGKAIFRHTGRTRAGRRVDETLTVAPYADARWRTDPKDSSRETYTELDAKGRRRLQKHYHAGRLDGPWIEWYSAGAKKAEFHYADGRRVGTWMEWYPKGKKRHEVRYEHGTAVGQELWWDIDGHVTAIGEHPLVPDAAGGRSHK